MTGISILADTLLSSGLPAGARGNHSRCRNHAHMQKQCTAQDGGMPSLVPTWDSATAAAAPLTPQPNVKMKSGSSRMLITLQTRVALYWLAESLHDREGAGHKLRTRQAHPPTAHRMDILPSYVHQVLRMALGRAIHRRTSGRSGRGVGIMAREHAKH